MRTPATPEVATSARTALLVSEPGVDGVFQYVRALENYLHGRGWTVHLAYSSVRDCPALGEFVARVAQRGGRTLDLRVGNSPGPADLAALRRLRALADETRPQVIHAHSSKAGVLGRMLAVLGGRSRYFYTPHAYYQMYGPTDLKKRFFSLIETALGRVGTTLCTSRSEARYAKERLRVPERRVCVAVTGVDCVRFHPPATDAEKQEARRRFGLPEGVRLAGTVARLSRQKDPLTLYRALASAMSRHSDFSFAHLGKGELTAPLDAFLTTLPQDIRARMIRVPSSEDTPGFYRGLDAFLLPSRYEGFALSALEALATGLPMILTDCPGNDDLKNYPFDSMRWVEVSNVEMLASNIVEWAADTNTPCNHRDVTMTELKMDDAWAGVVECYEESSAAG